MATIRIQNLTKRYGPVLGVDDLSFEVRPGQVTGFLGPNGSGKTTTLRILLGLATSTAGTATIGAAPPSTCGSSPRPPACPGAGSTRSSG
jgi:ABC-2 type transport system ATP-binding protein